MSYTQLAYLHLASIVPAFLIASFLLLNKKGSAQHKILGRIFMLLMLFTAVITLFMSAELGPTLLGHFGFIHGFSLLVLVSVPGAYLAARRGNIRRHRLSMLGLYAGGLLLAGGFALMPGRMLHDWLLT